MLETLLPMMMLVSHTQEKKASFCTLVTPSGMLTLDRAVPPKANIPMLVTLLGIRHVVKR